MLSIGLNIIATLFGFLKIPVFIVLSLVGLFFFLSVIQVVIQLIKGRRFKKGKHNRLRKRGILKRLLFDMPKQYVEDLFSKDPEFFRHQGCIIFTGRQGRGKTIGMMQFARQLQKEYPLSKCISNTQYNYQDDILIDWRQLIDYKNDKRGVVVIMDELQNWFSSNQSKNFPPEMLSVVTQNRKNRRIILGTAQNFYLLAKGIRSQATEVRECMTILGCLTIVRKKEPVLDAEGNVAEWKKRGMYFFVHNKELRESYDTYAVIESLGKFGFQEISAMAKTSA